MNNGLLLIDKPKGMTSHDVVNKIRKITGIKKVGHTGTLDPNATGLLVILIGKATKLIPYIPEKNKTYKADIHFGYETDTDDITGSITRQNKNFSLSEKELSLVLDSFKGISEQIPPGYSAKKIDGKKLYEYAREGKKVKIKPAEIEIEKIELTDNDLPEKASIEVVCSKGTYIRALVRDIGRELTTLATMGDLRRESSGDFYIEDAISLDELTKENYTDYLIPTEEIKTSLDSVEVSEEGIEKLKHGGKLYNSDLITDISNYEEGKMVGINLTDKLVGLGEIIKNDRIYVQPKKVFCA